MRVRAQNILSMYAFSTGVGTHLLLGAGAVSLAVHSHGGKQVLP